MTNTRARLTSETSVPVIDQKQSGVGSRHLVAGILGCVSCLVAGSFVGCGRSDRVQGTAHAATAEETLTTIEIGVGTQNTTTNTVTGGVVLKELGLFEKRLPHTGKYANVKYTLNWQNATSGPPITNGMMANNIQIGMMGDYPLLVNGATGQQTKNQTELVAIIAYNAFGGGNGVVVPKDSPYYDLADLKGKKVSVPFGSAAHGMLLAAMQSRGLASDFWELSSQSPEIGSTNLQEKRIDGHADFVPFAELLPFRGIARKIYDGAETKTPTFHGVVIRKDFGERYPEIVVAYIAAMIDADAWVRKDPRGAAEKIEGWTKINKEVVYMFLGPNGVHTLDPTIKPEWVSALNHDYGVLQKLNLVKPLEIGSWVNDRFVRKAYQEAGLDYEAQVKSFSGYAVAGHDPVCDVAIENPKVAGQIWVQDGEVVPFSSPVCTLRAIKRYRAQGKNISAAYVSDHALGIQLFADAAFYTVGKEAGHVEILPFLLKRDAEAHARQSGSKVASYQEALAAVPAESR